MNCVNYFKNDVTVEVIAIPAPVSVPGADVVLGHVMKTNEGGIPLEQQLRRHRHSPGSGILTVEVRPDGPTRVLRITDQDKKVRERQQRAEGLVEPCQCYSFLFLPTFYFLFPSPALPP